MSSLASWIAEDEMQTHSTPQVEIEGPIVFDEAEHAEIEQIVGRYPTRRSAMLPVLWMAQRKWGWLSFDVMRTVAKVLEQPPSEVYAVASFYTMLKKTPTGQYLLQICHTLPCAMRGADALVALLEERLGIRCGETTEDGLFTLMRVECLASCGSAPMMQVNDDFHELLDESRVDAILNAIRAGSPLSTPRPEVDEWAWTSQS
jgi:NADH-quinone oxidoreductase subunit E